MADAAVGAIADRTGCTVVRLRGSPSARKRLAIAAISVSGRPGMAGARAADQQRIAGGNKFCSFIGRYDARRHVRYAATPCTRSASPGGDAAGSSRPFLVGRIHDPHLPATDIHS